MAANRTDVNEIPKKQPASTRKATANRENAKKSTGPRTDRGKAISRRNAIKHGLFVRTIYDAFDRVDSRDYEENPEDFIRFYNALRDEKQPVGPSEEREVEYIAICWLRLARLLRYENAETERANLSTNIDIETGASFDIYEVVGRRELMLNLKAAKAEVVATGQLSPELKEKLKDDFYIRGMWECQKTESETVIGRNINEVAKMIAEKENISFNDAKCMLGENPGSNPHFVLAVQLNMIEAFINKKLKHWLQERGETLSITRQLHAIPDAAVDKVIRYGNAIERHMSRACARLERLQALRRGEHVAPILSVHLTR